MGVGLRAGNPPRLNPVITETTSRENSLYQGNTVTDPHNRSVSYDARGGGGWGKGEGQQHATELNRPLVNPQNILKIGYQKEKEEEEDKKPLTWS